MKKLLLIAFTLGANPVQASSIPLEYCNTAQALRDMLSNKYNEAVQFTGIKTDIHLEELWTNHETGSYSFVRTNIAEDVSCIISSGSNGVVKLTPSGQGI